MSAIQTPIGRRIYYDDLGQGTPLLFIPGAMSDRRGWMSPLTTSLAARHRVTRWICETPARVSPRWSTTA